MDTSIVEDIDSDKITCKNCGGKLDYSMFANNNCIIFYCTICDSVISLEEIIGQKSEEKWI